MKKDYHQIIFIFNLTVTVCLLLTATKEEKLFEMHEILQIKCLTIHADKVKI